MRQLLSLRSQIDVEKQRQAPVQPRVDPTQAHDARHLTLTGGKIQDQSFIQLEHRQAYHDLIDPQGGLRIGTQLLFWDGSIQYRDDQLKLNHFDFLAVNSYNPIITRTQCWKQSIYRINPILLKRLLTTTFS